MALLLLSYKLALSYASGDGRHVDRFAIGEYLPEVTAKDFAHALDRLELSPQEAARDLGVRISTIYRWISGQRKIPGPVEAALRCWTQRKREES